MRTSKHVNTRGAARCVSGASEASSGPQRPAGRDGSERPHFNLQCGRETMRVHFTGDMRLLISQPRVSL
ncbi:hypothetical protein EYF80_020422 [Liparis tanakae]|uniref:Uncharacterized protein n=1 Tax=Liparis tanakae TaxID=230148 RepID=A0A4Z2HV16_9TELE|nr:hypothetical protein EYF80_020422 [Liparis tanakae]